MKSGTIYIITLVLLIALAGCTAKLLSGTVGQQGEFGIGSRAPDIPIRIANDETTLNKERESILVLAFIPASANNLPFIHPELIELAETVKMLPVTVAQVTIPSQQDNVKVDTVNTENELVLFLQERNHIAQIAYHQPAPYTVFLVDNRERIRDIAKIGNITSLVENTKRLGILNDFDVESD
jgi:hypothetical protein